jgi:acylphosphatase
VSGLTGGTGATETVRLRVVVKGRVQGVWFRDSCRERAREESVGGWVRNRGDGAVEAEFEGAPAAVERMVAWCRSGPARARVDTVDVTTVPISGDRRFRVL